MASCLNFDLNFADRKPNATYVFPSQRQYAAAAVSVAPAAAGGSKVRMRLILLQGACTGDGIRSGENILFGGSLVISAESDYDTSCRDGEGGRDQRGTGDCDPVRLRFPGGSLNI